MAYDDTWPRRSGSPIFGRESSISPQFQSWNTTCHRRAIARELIKYWQRQSGGIPIGVFGYLFTILKNMTCLRTRNDMPAIPAASFAKKNISCNGIMYRQNLATHLGRIPAVVPPYSLEYISIPDSPVAPWSRVPRRSLTLGAVSALDPFAILAERFARCSHVTYGDSRKRREAVEKGESRRRDSKHQRYLFAFKT